MCSADSPGRSISGNNLLLIFDLDETVLSVNSFPHWASYMLAGRFGGLRLGQRIVLSYRTLATLLGRKLSGQSHLATKQRLQALWSGVLARDKDQTALKGLLQRLRKTLRPCMTEVIAYATKANLPMLLATAAAAEYAVPLGRMLGFEHVIASQYGKPENAGEQKRDNVLAWIDAQGWQDKKRIFFTDHVDDLPLIKNCQHVCWFGDASEMERIELLSQGVEFFSCLHIDAAAIIAFLQAA